MLYTASLQELKVVQFHSSEEAPELSLEMKEVLRLDLVTPGEFEKDWVRTWRRDLFWTKMKSTLEVVLGLILCLDETMLTPRCA